MAMTLQHSDHILKARANEWLLCSEPVLGVDMSAGGTLAYGVGARFRVKFSWGDLIWCLDENAKSVSFNREQMAALDRAPTRPGL